MRDLNCDGCHGAALLVVCGVLLTLQLFGHAVGDALRYDRAAISAGGYWRLLTAHLVHLDLRHAALDIGGLLLLWALFARDLTPARWAVVILTAAAAVDCGLWLRDPRIEWYVGASGVLHGVLAAAVLVRLRRGGIGGWLLAGLLVAKLAYEQIHGAMPFDGGMPVVVDAHLYGALGGLAAALPLADPDTLAGRSAEEGRGHATGE